MTDRLRKKVLQNIVKECYWDYNIDENDLENILKSNDDREKKKLFSKIMYNSKDKLLSLKLFSKEQLEDLFQDFKITYNQKYTLKHFLILKSLLLGEKNYIKSLEWKRI